MRTPSLLLSLLAFALLPGAAHAAVYDRPINIITGDYDLVDTTYIDRGRLDGVRVGDKFKVQFHDGKLATVVVVTGVFERMASVKIEDSWLLKNGQLANYKQRPMVVALGSNARSSALGLMPETSKAASVKAGLPTPNKVPPELGAPAVLPATDSGASPDAGGLPAGPGAAPASGGSSADLGASLDAGLPAAPGASSSDAGLPPGPGAAPDAGLPPAPSASAAPDAGLPPAPGASAAPDAGLPPAPGASAAPDAGLPPAPGAGAAPDASQNTPPPPPE